jgi:hypothetical protein
MCKTHCGYVAPENPNKAPAFVDVVLNQQASEKLLDILIVDPTILLVVPLNPAPWLILPLSVE